MGLIRTPAPPFKGRGHQPLGEFAQAHFHLTVSISAFLTHTRSYVGSWVCTQHPVGVTLLEDVARREASCADNERQQVPRQRRRLWSASWVAARAHREETPSEPESSGDDDEEEDEHEEEGEITPSPHSPPPEGLPSLGDLFSQQARISIGIRLMGTRASSGPLPPSDLLPVYSDVEGMSVYTRCDRNNSLTQGFVGPTSLVGHRGCCVCDDGTILIGHRGCGALIQGGTSLVSLASVHLVCVWC
jgi:hypothetical protein